MTQCRTLLTLILAGVVVNQALGQRVVRSHISQGQPNYGADQRRYLARRALLRRQSLDEDYQDESIESSDTERFIPLQFGDELTDEKESRSFTPHSGCEIEYETVTVVKQVPSFTKHCQKVEDTKCKTIYKNAFTTQIETQCMATFDTSCDDTLETAYKQECKTIVDVECRIVNLESEDGHHSKKICEDVPTEKCIPVPVKVEGQKCVNVSNIALLCYFISKPSHNFQVPTQMCENVPVTVAQEVPQQQCYKKPRKVCQTLVGTKPKVVTAQIPREVCGHEVQAKQKSTSFSSEPPSPPSSFPPVPSFRPSSILSKSKEKRPEPFQSERRPTREEDYAYDDDHDDRDEEEEDSFNFPRGHQPSAKPNTEGFNENLLQFLQQNK